MNVENIYDISKSSIFNLDNLIPEFYYNIKEIYVTDQKISIRLFSHFCFYPIVFALFFVSKKELINIIDWIEFMEKLNNMRMDYLEQVGIIFDVSTYDKINIESEASILYSLEQYIISHFYTDPDCDSALLREKIKDYKSKTKKGEIRYN